jgi:hypothetical protein
MIQAEVVYLLSIYDKSEQSSISNDGNNDHQYITGSITLEKLQALSKRDHVSVILSPQLNLQAVGQREVKEML